MYKAARCLKDKRHSAGAERLRGGGSSFANFGCGVVCSGLQMCLHLFGIDLIPEKQHIES